MSPADWWYIGGVYFLGYVVVMGWLFVKNLPDSVNRPLLLLILGLFYPVWLPFHWSYIFFRGLYECS